MDADAARADVAEGMTSADQVPARARKRRRVLARVARDRRSSNFERRVGARAVSDGGEASMSL